jgi:predicted PurR-regulated permease PerM
MNNSLFRYFLRNQVIFSLVIIVIALLILEIKGILIAIFISYIIMAAFLPIVEILRKKRLPRVLSVVIPYIIVFAFLTLLVIPLIPFFVSQIQSLFIIFPRYLDQAARILGIQIDASQLGSFFGSEIGLISQNAFALTSKVFGGVFSTLTIFVVSFYLLLDHDRIKKYLVNLFPIQNQKSVLLITSQIEEKLGGWFRGQIILSLFIGVITWIGLTFLGLEFALPLALIAGTLEIIPTIGPILAAIPAIIVALNTSPNTAIIVVVFYIFLQAVENNVLVPRIMQKAVGLHPIAIIISVIIGSELLGILGALLAIPFISLLLIIFNPLGKRA